MLSLEFNEVSQRIRDSKNASGAVYSKDDTETEAFYLADNAKNMPIVDEYLYYAVDMKMNSIEMTEKGREFVTKKGEDPISL